MRYLFSLIIILSINNAFGQKVDTTVHKPIYLPAVIINGDTTLPAVILEPFYVIEKKPIPIPERDKNYLKKVYPYALRTARILQQVDMDLAACKTKKQKKEYTKGTYKLIKDEFEDDIRNLTRIQGHYLCRLIHRQTGKTVNEIIKDYKGGMSAGWWNLTSKFFDQDLKDTYQPKGRDKWMEYYLLYLDEVYLDNGYKKVLENEQINTQIPSKKRGGKGSKP